MIVYGSNYIKKYYQVVSPVSSGQVTKLEEMN